MDVQGHVDVQGHADVQGHEDVQGKILNVIPNSIVAFVGTKQRGKFILHEYSSVQQMRSDNELTTI